MLQVKFRREMTHAHPATRPSTPTVSVRPVGAFADNYIWLVHSPRNPREVVAVDPGEAQPVLQELARSGLALRAILLTHHHADHIGGVPELARDTRMPVIGPDDERITVNTRVARGGDTVELPELGLAFETLEVPGHTLSHIAFWGHGSLFCGDTLFSGGCGRMFEGTARQMTTSLKTLGQLPPETHVYCGHEYTAANLRFALTVEPDNAPCAQYQVEVQDKRSRGLPTLPSTLALEIRINPFLRCGQGSVRAAAERHAGRLLADDAEVFGVLRSWKDQFR